MIVDDEQEREKQRALEAYRRDEELKRRELELAQQKAAALQAAKPKPHAPQAQPSPPKKGRYAERLNENNALILG